MTPKRIDGDYQRHDNQRQVDQVRPPSELLDEYIVPNEKIVPKQQDDGCYEAGEVSDPQGFSDGREVVMQ
jgi:hypothetical protein